MKYLTITLLLVLFSAKKSFILAQDSDDPTSLSLNYIWTLFLDKKDILWLNFIGGCTNIVDLNQNPNGLYQRLSYNANSLSNNNVTAVCQDRRGNFWIGHNSNALVKYNPGSETLAIIFTLQMILTALRPVY